MVSKLCLKRLCLIIACSFFLSSCAMYKRQFDCPIPCGMPCTSVTEIESMIVETVDGPDVLVITEEKSCSCSHPKDKYCGCQHGNGRIIWICNRRAPNGVPIRGKSVYVEVQGK